MPDTRWFRCGMWHGYSSEEVCAMLEISPGNLRVLLHRGPASLRGTLEDRLTRGAV